LQSAEVGSRSKSNPSSHHPYDPPSSRRRLPEWAQTNYRNWRLLEK
jgi:hypothetical protein